MAGYFDILGGQHEIPQTTRETMFGKVMDSGAIYDGKGRQVALTGTVPGWYIAASTPSASSLTATPTASTPSASSPAATPTASTPSAAGGGKSAAEDWYRQAMETLAGGVDEARAAAERANARVQNAGTDLNGMRQTASGLGNYANLISGQGDLLANLSQALLGGRADIGGLAGDYLGTIDQYAELAGLINPERYAAQAAADVQNSFDNVRGQQQREESRRGVSAGSGASAALRQQYERALATALAAVKTRARQSGVSDQMQVLASLASLRQSAMQTAQGANEAAQQAYTGAANVAQSETGLIADIAGMEVNLGKMELTSQEAVQSAITQAAAAQEAMAQFYRDTMDETKTVKTDTSSSQLHSTTTTTRSFA